MNTDILSGKQKPTSKHKLKLVAATKSNKPKSANGRAAVKEKQGK